MGSHRSRLVLGVALLALLMQAVLVLPVAASAPPLPDSMASTGDSITRAFATRGGFFWFTDNPAASWSTGTSSTVDSHYSRILAQNGAISGNNANDAVSGAKMADLAGQLQTVVAQHVQYVTILMGGNDVCTDSPDTMTSVSDFTAQLSAALGILKTGLPNALVYVVSIPDAYHLWYILKDNSSARAAWSAYSVCQSLLANPLSTAQADVARREFVRQRNIDFNTALANACLAYGANCRFDDNVIFNYPFAPSDINTHDYFHPSIAGQAHLAEASWAAGFWGSSAPSDQPPVASFTPACTGLSCTFTDASSDPDGSVTAWSWKFGDGGASTAQNPTHPYASDGTYTVSLTVTDNAGLSDSTSQTVTVSSGGAVNITLTATLGTATRNRQPVYLSWYGAGGASVDVYRDGSVIGTTTGATYTDTVNAKKASSYVYQVCLAGTSTCSNTASPS